MALGAQRGAVLKLIMGQGVILTVLGLGIGLVGTFVFTRMLAQFVFAIGTTDPLTLVASSILLCGVALAATLVPALRAMRIDPIVALRYE